MKPEQQGLRQFLFSKAGLALLGFLAVAGYFLWTEHQAHVIAALPWILVGGCLVMHLFMHGGHGGGHGGGQNGNSEGPGSHEGNGRSE